MSMMSEKPKGNHGDHRAGYWFERREFGEHKLGDDVPQTECRRVTSTKPSGSTGKFWPEWGGWLSCKAGAVAERALSKIPLFLSASTTLAKFCCHKTITVYEENWGARLEQVFSSNLKYQFLQRCKTSWILRIHPCKKKPKAEKRALLMGVYRYGWF